MEIGREMEFDGEKRMLRLLRVNRVVGGEMEGSDQSGSDAPHQRRGDPTIGSCDAEPHTGLVNWDQTRIGSGIPQCRPRTTPYCNSE